MHLPGGDERYLNDKGYKWQLIPDGNAACLVVSDFPISIQVFDHQSVDLMIRIPAQYNIAGLDMFYVDPEIKLRATGLHPDRANVFENCAGRRWQRFSRHLNTPWRPGVDGLPMFIALISKELRG